MMTTKREYETDKKQPHDLPWFPLVNRSIFVRAAIVAVVIGSILTLVNQFAWLAGREPLQLLQLILVFLLPFAVVTVAQVTGARQAYSDSVGRGAPARPESFMATAFSHGIPTRAVAIGLVFGSLNAIIVLADALLSSGDLAALSVAMENWMPAYAGMTSHATQIYSLPSSHPRLFRFSLIRLRAPLDGTAASTQGRSAFAARPGRSSGEMMGAPLRVFPIFFGSMSTKATSSAPSRRRCFEILRPICPAPQMIVCLRSFRGPLIK